eukprot:2961720-Amphidinium_carterae.1
MLGSLGSSSPPPASLVARVLTSEEGIGDPPDASFGRHAEGACAEQQGALEQEGDCRGAVQSAARTNDGQAIASIRGENRVSTASFLWPQTRSTQAEGKCSRSLVDVPGLRIPVGEKGLHGASTSCRREEAMWSSQGKPLRSDPGELQKMGHQRVRAGWRQYGTTIAAVLSLGLAEEVVAQSKLFQSARGSTQQAVQRGEPGYQMVEDEEMIPVLPTTDV